MSIWYQYTLIAKGSQEAIAKFFNHRPEDIRSDSFEISFGCKNGPGLNINKIVKQNSELIFLIKEEDDYGSSIYLDKFDTTKDKCLSVHLSRVDYGIEWVSYNSEMLDYYKKAFPEKNDKINWENFFFNKDINFLVSMLESLKITRANKIIDPKEDHPDDDFSSALEES